MLIIMQKGTDITSSDASRSNKACETVNATSFYLNFDEIFTFEHLYASYEKCTRGVKWKWSTQNYMINACCRIARLYKKLQNETYKSPKPQEFTICERGKTRKITALGFEDRVVNKCLCDYCLNPLLSRSLIHDSGATLEKKGLSFTKRRMLCHLQRFYRKHGNKGYVLKIDIHHYFESINHEILFEKLNAKIKDEKLMCLIKQLVRTSRQGLGLGSQVSQISAMFYLSSIDHFLKEKMQFKYYGRYADDIYIIDNDKEKLKRTLITIRKLMHEHKLQLNETKTKIYELDRGFVFCKTRYILKENGQILKLLTSRSVISMKHKIKKGVDLVNIIPSFESYLREFDAYYLLCKIQKQYNINI